MGAGAGGAAIFKALSTLGAGPAGAGGGAGSALETSAALAARNPNDRRLNAAVEPDPPIEAFETVGARKPLGDDGAGSVESTFCELQDLRLELSSDGRSIEERTFLRRRPVLVSVFDMAGARAALLPLALARLREVWPDRCDDPEARSSIASQALGVASLLASADCRLPEAAHWRGGESGSCEVNIDYILIVIDYRVVGDQVELRVTKDDGDDEPGVSAVFRVQRPQGWLPPPPPLVGETPPQVAARAARQAQGLLGRAASDLVAAWQALRQPGSREPGAEQVQRAFSLLSCPNLDEPGRFPDPFLPEGNMRSARQVLADLADDIDEVDTMDAILAVAYYIKILATLMGHSSAAPAALAQVA